MPYSGNTVLLHQLRLSPLFIIDHNLSYALADALSACGFDVTSVKAVFPNKERVEDEEIIDWLEKQGRERSVWITADEKAQKVHAKYILAKEISVLWVVRPKNGLSTLKALQLLSLIIEPLAQLISSTKQPLYLRTSISGKRTKLERLITPLSDKSLIFKKIPIR